MHFGVLVNWNLGLNKNKLLLIHIFLEQANMLLAIKPFSDQTVTEKSITFHILMFSIIDQQWSICTCCQTYLTAVTVCNKDIYNRLGTDVGVGGIGLGIFLEAFALMGISSTIVLRVYSD